MIDAFTPVVLPDSDLLRLETVTQDQETHTLRLVVQATPSSATCPICGGSSTRVHSRYLRHLADLPIADWPVRLLLHVRKFFCTTMSCARAIFTERLPTVVAPWARRTRRLAAAQTQIALALGGAPAARLAQHLAMPLGIDALLQLLRQHPLPELSTPRVVGIDDWALRKGHTYGTIIIDLETHQPLALLKDRSADTVAQWLADHPSVEIVARDRASAYAEGVSKGAPQARQVADRWHLLGNLGDALERVLRQHQPAIEQALRTPTTPSPPAASETWAPSTPEAAPAAPSPGTPTRREQEQQQRQGARLARYERVHELHAQGLSQRAIVAELGMERKTVRKYLQTPASAIVTHQGRNRTSLLDPYRDYLVERWNAGCRNGMELLREIEAKGYTGKRSILRAFLTTLRKAQGLAPRSTSGEGTPATVPAKRPSLRTLVWRILGRGKAKTLMERATEQQQIVILRGVAGEIGTAVSLAQEFTAMVRQRQVEQFPPWMERAEASGIAAIEGFAAGVRQDEAAVWAGLELPWSTGPVEGQINRLKLLKRQSYGQAKLDLLERRLRAS